MTKPFDLDRYLVDSLAEARAVHRPRPIRAPSLADTIEEQAETIRQLRALLVPDVRFPARWKLTPMQARILAVLLGCALHARSLGQIMDVLYAARPDDAPDERIVDVAISKMRKALAADGIAISSQWGVGRFIAAPDARRLIAFCRDEMLATGGSILTIVAEASDDGPVVALDGDILSPRHLDQAIAALRQAGARAWPPAGTRT